MRSLKRNKTKFYLCKLRDDGFFDEPVKQNLNYQPVFSIAERLVVGEDYKKYLRIKCTREEAEKFSNQDRCFIFVEPPSPHNKLCEDADYVVYGEPLKTLNEAEINLRKLSAAYEQSD